MSSQKYNKSDKDNNKNTKERVIKVRQHNVTAKLSNPQISRYIRTYVTATYAQNLMSRNM